MGWLFPTSLEVTAAICGSIYVISHWMMGKCRSKASLEGKTVIVTGANAGIGLYTALDFANRNGRVILACRNMEKGQRAKEEIVRKTNNKNIVLKHLDISLMKSVRKFASEILTEEDRIDILVNNAGIANWNQTMTEEGLEQTWATNHFGPFLLTNLLLDRMLKTPKSRIVNVTSNANFQGKIEFNNLSAEKYYDMKSYNNSKLGMVLFTKELARKTDKKILVNCVHPGFVHTDIFQPMPWFVKGFIHTIGRLFSKTPKQGAETTIHCAVSEEVEGISGAYYSDCKVKDHSFWVSKLAYDEGLAKKLWDVSERVTGLKS